jgi:hypothetical protein
MFGLKHGKAGDNFNIFKPGYHLSKVKNVVTTSRKTKHIFIINIYSLVLFREMISAKSERHEKLMNAFRWQNTDVKS